MRLFLLFSRDDITDENSSMNFFLFLLHDLGGLYVYIYIFPMVIVFDKLFPVTLIIGPSQCSYIFRLIFT